MKLEPKHLFPYGPYSLKVIMEGKKTNVAWMSTKNIAVIRPDGIGEYKRIAWRYAHLNIKPILRPLSDLTKEIAHNGETFCPLNILSRMYKTGWKWLPNELHLFASWDDHNKHYRSPTLEMYQKLYEWHFDVFGLIEKGLAIDINTLNNG